jgi:hypothetical protein
MRHLATAILIVCAVAGAPSAAGLSFEYGRPGEIKGVHKVFIDFGPEITMRNEMAAYLEGELPGVKVTDRAEDAEAVIAIA